MNPTLNLNENTTVLSFDWQPLLSNGNPCYLWAYSVKERDKDLPVVYRHVLQNPACGEVTIYVGEGSSLCGPSKACLAYQYGSGGHGESRRRVIDFVRQRKEKGRTEILALSSPRLNLQDGRLRKFVQATLIAAYDWEHQRLLAEAETYRTP